MSSIDKHKKLNLKEITFYVINLEEHTEKKEFMKRQLQELGLRYVFVPGIKERRPIGIALSHLKILRNQDFELPFVILEDDAEFFQNRIEYNLYIPKNTDALYLGHSTFGVRDKDQYGLKWGKNNAVKYSVFNDQYLRIYSMLGRHAILYISEKFRNNTIKANERALLNYDFPYPGDMAYEEIQAEHFILAPHYPWCYQSEKHGGNHPATKPSIKDGNPPLEKS